MDSIFIPFCKVPRPHSFTCKAKSEKNKMSFGLFVTVLFTRNQADPLLKLVWYSYKINLDIAVSDVT